MSVTIAITKLDGSFAIMAFSTRNRAATTEAIEAEIAATLGPVARWRVVPLNDFPQDDPYADAWVDDGKSISHDMVRAREVHRQLLRTRRGPPLAQADLDFMRAMEGLLDQLEALGLDVSEAASVVRRKRRLRNAPADPRIDAAETIEELAAIDPLEDL